VRLPELRVGRKEKGP